MTSKVPMGINSDIPCAFETAAFKGHMLFYVDGLPSSPPRLFQGRKRRTHLVIKVRPGLSVPLERTKEAAVDHGHSCRDHN